jgi:hypothetical protein
MTHHAHNTTHDTRVSTRPGRLDETDSPPRGGVREVSMSMRRSFTLTLLVTGAAALLAGGALAASPRAMDPGQPAIERNAPVTPVPVLGSTVVNLAELARRSAAVPDVAKPPLRVLDLERNERDDDEEFRQPDASGLLQAAPFGMGRQLFIASPAPTRSFAGLDDIAMVDSSYIIIPPDVNGVVGPSKIFQNLNNNVRVLDKTTGAVLGTVGVNTWWAGTGASPNNYTDPRSTYDPYNGRFITITQGDLDKPTGNTICLGVSDTDDPTGSWHLYRFTAYENSTYQYADYPTLGFNKNWITISINMYNSTQTAVRRSVFMVHYPTLRNSFSATVFRADYGTSGVICGAPCVTYSATCDTQYVIQRRGTSTYSIDLITGTGPAAPTYTIGAALTRPGGAWSALGTSNYLPQGAPVSGTSACGTTPCAIERNDDNIRSSPVYRGGQIWFTQAVGLPSASATHVATQWTQINAPSGSFVVGGRLQDTLATVSNGRPHYANPSIAVNQNGDFLLGFTRFSSTQHPGAGYAMHLASDGLGTLRDTVIAHDGEDYYHKTFSTATGRNRWGDFSTTQVDPSDDLTLWTVQEYAKARTGTDDGNTGSNSSRWGTWWAGVTPTGVFTITASAGTGGTISPAGAVAVNQGADRTFTITPGACRAIADVLVDGVSQGPITTYTFTNVQAAHTIAASFSVLGPYTVAASAGAGGAIAPSGDVSVACGAGQAFTITPAACQHVVDVLVDGVSQGAITAYTFNNVTAGHTIAATFAVNGPYTITASAGAHGAIAPNGGTSVACGDSLVLTLTPDANHHVADVLVDGVSVGAPTSYTFRDVQAGHTIAASFAITTYTITATAGPNGSIAPSGATVVDSGTDQSFTMTANSGFYLSTLTVDGGPVTPVSPYTFTDVQAAHTIAAGFASDAAVIGGTSSTAVLSPLNLCDTIPVTLTRSGGTPVLGFSVTFQLSPELSLCAGTASLLEGSFLSSVGPTLFNVIDHGSGLYSVDGALTAACGATADHGTLFSIAVTGSGAATSGSVTMTTFKLRDCTNAALVTVAGAPATVPLDFMPPALAVVTPNGGEQLTVDGSYAIGWTASDPHGVAGVSLLLSRTGAAGSFEPLASGLTASPFLWTVTSPLTTDAYVKVVAADSLGNAGSDLSDAAFEIKANNSVDGTRPLQFALLPITPNPQMGHAHVQYTLPREASVRLAIVDLQGREVAVLANGLQSAGTHTATWSGSTGSGRAAAGVYFVRYQTPVQTFVRRLVLAR